MKNRYNLLFSDSNKLVLLNQNVVRVSLMNFTLCSHKAILFTKSWRFLSNSLVHGGKTVLQKPSSDETVFAVRGFFQTQECLYVQAGCHGAVSLEVANPTRELEMSSSWDTDYGKYNSPRCSRQEVGWNVLIQRGRVMFQGALGLNEIHCLIIPQMGC